MSEEMMSETAFMQNLMSDSIRRSRLIRSRIKDDRANGESALRRLLPLAQGFTGQSERIARLLLGLYNGHRFPFDMTNLRCLDYEIMEDCLAVLRMDANAYQEVHLYFENGSEVFEKLAREWSDA
ncbi:MAG TPA: hypothetical protein PK225_02535 [Azonexus sp.]|nr:hypothetical protein [Azonexus sp.]